MKNIKNIKIILLILTIGLSAKAFSGMGEGISDDPIIVKVMGEIETRATSGDNPQVINLSGWIGKDLDKFWFKYNSEKVGDETESQSLQLLYSKAIDSYWDLQIGAKKDFNPKPNRTWGVVGIKGLLPYLIETDVSVAIGKSGIASLDLDFEYEYMLTQNWVLFPELEIAIHNKDDAEVGIGKGLSSVEFGIRLGYEITREFMPYIGINWEKKYGNTANFAKSEDEDIEDSQIVIGVRFWF